MAPYLTLTDVTAPQRKVKLRDIFDALLNRFRRLANDNERVPETLAASFRALHNAHAHVRPSIALPPKRSSVRATCGVTLRARQSLTKSLRSYALSVLTVFA